MGAYYAGSGLGRIGCEGFCGNTLASLERSLSLSRNYQIYWKLLCKKATRVYSSCWAI